MHQPARSLEGALILTGDGALLSPHWPRAPSSPPAPCCQPHLLAILLVLDGVHGAAGLGVEHEVEAGVFTETTGIAQEGILLIIIDGPERQGSSSKPAAQGN